MTTFRNAKLFFKNMVFHLIAELRIYIYNTINIQ